MGAFSGPSTVTLADSPGVSTSSGIAGAWNGSGCFVAANAPTPSAMPPPATALPAVVPRKSVALLTTGSSLTSSWSFLPAGVSRAASPALVAASSSFSSLLFGAAFSSRCTPAVAATEPNDHPLTLPPRATVSAARSAWRSATS